MTSPVKSSVELVLLGISADSPPDKSSFPKKFNQTHGKSVWAEILDSPAFARQSGKNSDKWLWAIKTYLVLCKRRSIFPFMVGTEQATRDTMYRMLVQGRQRAVLFAEKFKLFEKISVLTTKREFHFASDSFMVNSYAQLSPIEDPTFKRWLTDIDPGPGFVASGIRSGLYVRDLTGSSYIKTRFEFDLVNYSRPVLLLSLGCDVPMVQSHVNKLMNLRELTSYVDEFIWVPLIRTHRFSNTNNRLF